MSPTTVDLQGHLNAAVATFNSERRHGALNSWGNSFPAEELPFGSSLTLRGIAFRLAAKAPGDPDSIDPLGQTIAVPGAPRAGGIALLCLGEMGEQYLPVRVVGRGGQVEELVAAARGGAVPGGFDPGEDGVVATHLHYPGDYELALLRAVVWRFEHRWRVPLEVVRIELGANPLFHLLAITLLDPEVEGGS
jgi:hypothetical protein